MKKILKITAILGSLTFIVFIFALFQIYRSLPTPAEIGRYLLPAPEINLLTQAPPTAVVSVSNDSSTAVNNLPRPSEKQDVNFSAQSDRDRKVISILRNPEDGISNFCDPLLNRKMTNDQSIDVKARLAESITTDHKDAFSESFTPVLKHLFRQPELSKLISSAEEAARENNLESVSKSDFYAQAFTAYREMMKNAKEIEAVIDRTYLLRMLHKVLEQRPDLDSNPEFAGYCVSLEKIINTNVPDDFSNEKKNFEMLLAEIGVSPEAIGYDPNYKTLIKPKLSKSGLYFSGGWFSDELMK